MEFALDSPEKVHASLAPAQGLFLSMSIFEGYNRRKNKDAEDLKWVTDETTAGMQRLRELKEGVIMPHICKEEAKEGNLA